MVSKVRKKKEKERVSGRFYVREQWSSLNPRVDVHIYPTALKDAEKVRNLLFKYEGREGTPFKLRIFGLSDGDNSDGDGKGEGDGQDGPLEFFFEGMIGYVDLSKFKKSSAGYRFQITIPTRVFVLVKDFFKKPTSGPITLTVEDDKRTKELFKAPLFVIDLYLSSKKK